MNFAESEFANRYASVRSELERLGADALLVTGEANFNYFTGYIAVHPWVSYSRNLIALLPREGPPALVIPEFLAQEARDQSWIELVYPSTAVGEAPVATIAAALRDLDLANATIGAELGYEQRLGISYRDFERLREAVPEACFVDASEAIWALRMRKSAAEIHCLREACRVTDRALERLFAELRPGMTERDSARRLGQLLLAEGADRVGWIMMTSGRGQYHRTFGVPRDRVPEPGDMVWLDVSAIVNGYGADFNRAAIIGGPSPAQAALQAAVHEATMAGIGVVRPGVAIQAVVEAVSDALARSGLQRLDAGRIGHGLGLQSSEPRDVALSDATVLAPGMVFTVEPAIVREDGIYQVEQNVVVTESGCEILSRSPYELRTV
jgi:Xaa-Pro aminopeptidase